MHLRVLLADPGRCKVLRAEADGITLDYSRQQVGGCLPWVSAPAAPAAQGLTRTGGSRQNLKPSLVVVFFFHQ
jgi:hypothetical protein